jgi:DNA-binding transcriptional LysR family regulator
MSVLGQLRDDVLSGGTFDPRQTRQSFGICLSDVGSYVLWPKIVRAVRARAPLIELRLRNLTTDALEAALEQGEADLAIGAFTASRASLFQRRLFEREYVCLARASHPYANVKMTLQQFASAPQIVVRTSAGVHDRIDEQLSKRDLVRSSLLEIPSYLLIPPLLESDDYLAVMPGQLAEVFAEHWNLVAVRLPLSLPTSTIRLYWHRRSHEDQGNVWLRQLIVRELTDER